MANDNNAENLATAVTVEDAPQTRDVYFKVLVVGEPAVGKSAVINRYVQGKFETVYKSTIGVCFHDKVIAWSPNTKVHLQFWDLAGQDRLNNQVKMYYREAAGALCVCDAARIETRKQVLAWKKMVDENCTNKDGSSNVPPSIMIVNKMDLYGTLDDPWIDNEPHVTKQTPFDETFYTEAEDPDGLLAKPKRTYDDFLDARRQRDTLTSYPDSINRKVNEVSINNGFHAGVPTSVKENTGLELAIEILITEMLRRYDSEEERQKRRELEEAENESFKVSDEVVSAVRPYNSAKCNYC